MTTTLPDPTLPSSPLPVPTTGSSRALLWPVLGALLLCAAHFRWGIGIFGWLAPIPFLRYLRGTQGWRSRLFVSLMILAGFVATTAKIVTPPLPMFFALLGIGFGLVQVPGYLAWGSLRRHVDARWSPALFASIMTLLEWLEHRFTPLASWGAAAYTQVENLPLLQVASLFGMAGVSFLIYWVAAAGEAVLSAHLDRTELRPAFRQTGLALAVVLLAHTYGGLRLAAPLSEGTLQAAAVGTVATFNAEVLPDSVERARIEGTLLEDTARAARAGARLVVWNEGAALVWPEEEEAFVERAAEKAREAGIHLVISYVVPQSLEPMRYENKYRWLTPAGTVDHTWLKHNPAPGEPAVVGLEAPVAVDLGGTRASGAICYDYDYPALAAQHGALGLDLIALPSSDWQGIDPIHTQMAAVRAIEQGTSIVRSTRFGLSAGIDPLGRMRAWRSSFEASDRVLVASLPAKGVPTLYRQVGDVLIAGCVVVLVLAGWRAVRRFGQPGTAEERRGVGAREESVLA